MTVVISFGLSKPSLKLLRHVGLQLEGILLMVISTALKSGDPSSQLNFREIVLCFLPMYRARRSLTSSPAFSLMKLKLKLVKMSLTHGQEFRNLLLYLLSQVGFLLMIILPLGRISWTSHPSAR